MFNDLLTLPMILTSCGEPPGLKITDASGGRESERCFNFAAHELPKSTGEILATYTNILNRLEKKAEAHKEGFELGDKAKEVLESLKKWIGDVRFFDYALINNFLATLMSGIERGEPTQICTTSEM